MKYYTEKYYSESIKHSIDSLQLTKNEKLRIYRICYEYDIYDSIPSLVGINFSYNSDDSISFKTDNFEILIKSIKFQETDHLIFKDQDLIFAIDNEVVYGTGLEVMPKTELSRFDVLFRGKKIEFFKSEWGCFYNPNIECTNSILGLDCQIGMCYDKEYNNIYVNLSGADGGHAYAVIFVFKEGKYVGKAIYM